MGSRTIMSDFESTSAMLKMQARKLAVLMAAGNESSSPWRADELASVFRHQMSAPILVDLVGFNHQSALRLKNLSESKGLLLKSFTDLFCHPSPVLEILEMVKDFAKANLNHPESALPREIAAALYYISIAAAWVRLNKRITQLPDSELQRGLTWTLEQSWIDDHSKELLDTAIKKIQGVKKETAS